MILVILGGVGRVVGPVAGAVVFVLLEHFLVELTDFWHIFLGAILLIIVLFARGGIVGLICGEKRANG